MQSMIHGQERNIDERSVEKRKESINIASYQFTISVVLYKSWPILTSNHLALKVTLEVKPSKE